MLLNSREFRPVPVRIDLVRDNPSGKEFCDRFLGGRKPGASAVKLVRKKAKIMQHWAATIGVRMNIEF